VRAVALPERLYSGDIPDASALRDPRPDVAAQEARMLCPLTRMQLEVVVAALSAVAAARRTDSPRDTASATTNGLDDMP